MEKDNIFDVLCWENGIYTCRRMKLGPSAQKSFVNRLEYRY